MPGGKAARSLDCASMETGVPMELLQRIFLDEDGTTAVEYGLIAGLVAVAVMVSISALGDSMTELFENTAATMSLTEY